MSEQPSRSWRRYGLVALAFDHLAVSRGIHGTFGVFYVALLEAFGWSRASTAAAVSVAIILEGISQPVVGFLTDRLGGRRTLVIGGIILALGLGFSATIGSLLELYFWLGVVTAFGLALIGMVPHITILSREFSKHRGMALGIAYAGGGMGIFLLVPITQFMISTWGWPAAYVSLAAVSLVLVVPPSMFAFPQNHRGVGHSQPREKNSGLKSPAVGTVSFALGSVAFWLLFGTRILASMGNQIITTHQIAHVVDVGFSKLFAASVFGMMGIASIFGRLFFGYLADRMRRETVFTLVQIVSSLGIGFLLILRENPYQELLYAYALFYGLGQGSRALVLSSIFADIFLGKSFGAVYGYFTLSIGVGGALGAWLGGFIFDMTGSYAAAFLISLACFGISIVVVWVNRVLLSGSNAG